MQPGCAFGGEQGRWHRAHEAVHSFNPMVQDILGCGSLTEGHLCEPHSAVLVCSACGQAVSRLGTSPTNLDLNRGITFFMDWRALTAEHKAALGRHCAGTPGAFDQFHARVTARICDSCRKQSARNIREKAAKAERVRVRINAEAARKAAAIAAAAPDMNAPAISRSARNTRATRESAGAAARAPGTRQGRSRNQARPAQPLPARPPACPPVRPPKYAWLSARPPARVPACPHACPPVRPPATVHDIEMLIEF